MRSRSLPYALGLASLLLLAAPGDDVAAAADLEQYGKCVGAFTQKEGTIPDRLALCAGPAQQGLAGAQFAVAMLLLENGQADGREQAIAWLEKAARSGHPIAAHTAARLLLRDPVAERRASGVQHLTTAYCAGYPGADETAREAGIDPAQLVCRSRTAASFDGVWTGQPAWVQAPAGAPAPAALKIVIGANKAHVWSGRDGKWSEVKPGKFRLVSLEDSAMVLAIDSGWDIDGRWVESWTLHLLRLTADSALLNWVRTVNNVHAAADSPLRAFTTVAEGTLARQP
jgi:hypothetical protein